MLKAQMDTKATSEAVRSGRMAEVMQRVSERMKPEAAYFGLENGERCAFFFFEMDDTSGMPPIGEPLFSELGAKLTLTPVMNQDELSRGVSEVAGG